jgi:hypothetical protein
LNESAAAYSEINAPSPHRHRIVTLQPASQAASKAMHGCGDYGKITARFARNVRAGVAIK